MASNRPYDFYKRKPTDTVWWVDTAIWGEVGLMLFSFDRKTIYNLFLDYRKLPPDLKAIFDKDNPELVRLLFS